MYLTKPNFHSFQKLKDLVVWVRGYCVVNKRLNRTRNNEKVFSLHAVKRYQERGQSLSAMRMYKFSIVTRCYAGIWHQIRMHVCIHQHLMTYMPFLNIETIGEFQVHNSNIQCIILTYIHFSMINLYCIHTICVLLYILPRTGLQYTFLYVCE